jgi:hypothetical protein
MFAKSALLAFQTIAATEMAQAPVHPLVDEASTGLSWLREIEFDGYRMHAGWLTAKSNC